MTTNSPLSTDQIDADSPIIEDTLIKLRDNPLAMFEGSPGAPRLQTAAINDGAVTNEKIASGAVGQVHISSGAVHQAELNTSYGEVTIGFAPSAAILPGGEYGFYPRIKRPTGGTSTIVLNSGGAGTNYATYIAATANNAGITHISQRYVNSSPPYNLGDGDVPLFFFGLIRKGKLLSTYSANVPPWGYNGPTSVKAEAVGLKGEKYKINRIANKETGKVKKNYEKITHAVKNSDMGIIPHPFGELKKGDEVILLNPPGTIDLLDMHEAGESIAGLFQDDYLLLDSTPIIRATPSGVKACRYKWKNTK